MSEKRIVVWVQRFPDRDNLVLQWHDPDTGKRKSKSAETADEGEAERKRADLDRFSVPLPAMQAVLLESLSGRLGK